MTKPDTKKVFHFPKSAEAGSTVAAAVPAADPTTAVKPAKPSGGKTVAAARKSPARAEVKATPAARKPVNKAAKPPTKTATKAGAKSAKTTKSATKSRPTKTPTPKTAAASKPRAKPVVADKEKRAKKEKVIRDSFTMPASDYARIAALKQTCLANGVGIKKSELLRAGLILLEALPIDQLRAAVAAVETIKTGRPAKS